MNINKKMKEYPKTKIINLLNGLMAEKLFIDESDGTKI